MKAKGEAGGRGWEDGIVSLTQWTRIWANSGRQWRTGKPRVLQSLESQRVGHYLVTQSELCSTKWFCSVMSNSVIPWTVVYQAPLSMEFSRQKYWSGLPFPSPEDLPDPGIKPRSPTLQADALPSEPPGNFFSDWRTTIIGYCTSK